MSNKLALHPHVVVDNLKHNSAIEVPFRSKGVSVSCQAPQLRAAVLGRGAHTASGYENQKGFHLPS